MQSRINSLQRGIAWEPNYIFFCASCPFEGSLFVKGKPPAGQEQLDTSDQPPKARKRVASLRLRPEMKEVYQMACVSSSNADFVKIIPLDAVLGIRWSNLSWGKRPVPMPS